MTEARLRELRGLVRRGELPEDLVAELRAVAHRLVRNGMLPRSFSPYGIWDAEAAEELFADWYADRLLRRGQLQVLLDRALTGPGFRRLAERSLRQHVLNARDRSQAQNLYRRLVTMLAEDPAFRLARDAARPQDRWFAKSEAGDPPSEWTRDDRNLVAHAWSLGDFVVIRYRAAANKLSPVLDAGELRRFAVGLLDRTDSALTANLMMRALSARFDLGEVQFVAAEESAPTAATTPSPGDEMMLAETVRAVLSELTQRQREVLRRSADDTVAAIADAVGCSIGTVVNEQRRIGELVTRLSEDGAEKERVLKMASDRLYLDHDE